MYSNLKLSPCIIDKHLIVQTMLDPRYSISIVLDMGPVIKSIIDEGHANNFFYIAPLVNTDLMI